MLSPDSRAVAMELLRPPSDARLDCALLTTYSLDLEALLALPLAVFAQADGGINELLSDPLRLLQGIREAGERVHVFVDAKGIAVPGQARNLYTMLEASVHPTRAPNGGAFHPKVWIVRFLRDEAPPLLRVAILSRNLTFDRSWDVALVTEASPAGERPVRPSTALGDLLRALPDIAAEPVSEPLRKTIGELADQVERTKFPGPEEFDSPIEFTALGLPGSRRRAWRPLSGGSRLLAIAPFVNQTALRELEQSSGGQFTLVSRREELDKVPVEAFSRWKVWTMADAAHEEAEDEMGTRPSGLHAKVIGIEHGRRVTWFVGSANLTAAAFTGANVEMMAAVTALKGRTGGQSGFGIERFENAGFMKLCQEYEPTPRAEEDTAIAEGCRLLESARDRLAQAELVVTCIQAADEWSWTLDGTLDLPDGVEVRHWPATLERSHARAFALPSTWTLPASHLTAFVAFVLKVATPGVDDIELTLKLPVEGMPEGRVAAALRNLIDSPERFLQFLRALLGGLDGTPDLPGNVGGQDGKGAWEWLGGDSVLEDLIRVASRDPARLEAIRSLLRDLNETEEGRKVVPNDFLAIWNAVDQAVRRGVAREQA
jgi:hypothetical protein